MRRKIADDKTTTMTIEESNKLIAEFMQIPKCGRCKDCGAYQYSAAIIFYPKEMLYATDWNWLMPVIDKIGKYEFAKELDEQESDTAYMRTFHSNMARINRFPLHVAETQIKACYEAVVEFILFTANNSQSNN